MLVGGAGKDKLKGGEGRDILIGGTGSADNDLAVLDAALAEWEADDLADVLTLLTFSDDGEKDELKPSQGDAVCSY